MVNIIWIIFVLFAVWFLYVLAVDILKHKNELEEASWIKTGLIGFWLIFLMC